MSALVGVRIVEWSRHFPAAMAAMHLADQGAEVVTIGRADETDRLVPGYLSRGTATRRGCTSTWTMRPTAPNSTVCSRTPTSSWWTRPIDELERVGLDGPALTTAHPRLVHAWAPPYGERGD